MSRDHGPSWRSPKHCRATMRPTPTWTPRRWLAFWHGLLPIADGMLRVDSRPARQRERDGERRPGAGRALDRDSAAMRMDDPLRQRQSQPSAMLRSVLVERARRRDDAIERL